MLEEISYTSILLYICCSVRYRLNCWCCCISNIQEVVLIAACVSERGTRLCPPVVSLSLAVFCTLYSALVEYSELFLTNFFHCNLIALITLFYRMFSDHCCHAILLHSVVFRDILGYNEPTKYLITYESVIRYS